MKVKVLKGTELFDSLHGLYNKIKDANDQAKALALTIPGLDQFYIAPPGVAGGMTGMTFKKGFSPDRRFWKLAFPGQSTVAFFPKQREKNRELLKKIKALPVIFTGLIHEVLKYDIQIFGVDDQSCLSTIPVITFGAEYTLVHINENAVYEKLEDMIEVDDLEYEKLKAEIKNPE